MEYFFSLLFVLGLAAIVILCGYIEILVNHIKFLEMVDECSEKLINSQDDLIALLDRQIMGKQEIIHEQKRLLDKYIEGNDYIEDFIHNFNDVDLDEDFHRCG